MKSDEVRSHRLNTLLQVYLRTRKEQDIFTRAKQMGVTDSTARDYLRTVIMQARKSKF